jgi:hypothetical protein
VEEARDDVRELPAGLVVPPSRRHRVGAARGCDDADGMWFESSNGNIFSARPMRINFTVRRRAAEPAAPPGRHVRRGQDRGRRLGVLVRRRHRRARSRNPRRRLSPRVVAASRDRLESFPPFPRHGTPGRRIHHRLHRSVRRLLPPPSAPPPSSPRRTTTSTSGSPRATRPARSSERSTTTSREPSARRSGPRSRARCRDGATIPRARRARSRCSSISSLATSTETRPTATRGSRPRTRSPWTSRSDASSAAGTRR